RSRPLSTPDGYCAILCHARTGLPETTPFDQMIFPHQLHVEGVEVPCTSCHSPEKHKTRTITRSECMACHHGAQDIACAHCHPAQEALYRGTASAWGVTGEPDAMAAAGTSCTDCHDLSAPHSIEGVQQACVRCHEAGFDEMLAEWVNEVQKGLGEVTLQLAEARRLAATGAQRGQPAAEGVKLADQAARLVQLVEQGKGTHNHPLSMKLLGQAKDQLERASKLLRGEATVSR
ncbi:MAG: hypothetical protein WDA75_05500, partial [Candidatus Latescibacterota bacterium]